MRQGRAFPLKAHLPRKNLMMGSGATPTLVQRCKFGGTSAKTTLKKWPLPNAVLSGNCLIVAGQGSNAQTPTVKDNLGNIFTIIQNTNDAGNSQRAWIAYRANITDGPTEVQLTFTGAGIAYVTGIVTEWYNLAASPADGGSGAATSGTSGAPGSLTTTVDGDLIFTYIVQDSVDPFVTDQCMDSWTTPTSFTLLGADVWAGDAAAFYVQPARGTSNPSWTLSPSRSTIVSQAAFRSDRLGTAPTISPRVIGTIHQGLDYHGAHVSPYTIQTPFMSNATALYAAFIGLRVPGAMTDSQANGWADTGAQQLNTSGGNSGSVRCYYMIAPSIANAMTLSLAYTGVGASFGDTLILYEMVGVTAWSVHAGNNNITGVGTSYQIGAITPAAANGIVFSTAGQDSQTSLSVDTGSFVPSTDPTEEVSPWANDENNAWSFYLNPNTTAVQPTYTTDGAAVSVAWISDAFSQTAVVASSRYYYDMRLN